MNGRRIVEFGLLQNVKDHVGYTMGGVHHTGNAVLVIAMIKPNPQEKLLSELYLALFDARNRMLNFDVYPNSPVVTGICVQNINDCQSLTTNIEMRRELSVKFLNEQCLRFSFSDGIFVLLQRSTG